MSDVCSRLAASHPKLVRGRVWCLACGSSRRCDSAEAFLYGWPKCCGHTMTIDEPSPPSSPPQAEAAVMTTISENHQGDGK